MKTNSECKAAFSINSFCEAHEISRAMYYKLQTDGRGPREMLVGSKKLISVEAAADWRKAMEQEAA